jgi:hypothetical protein
MAIRATPRRNWTSCKRSTGGVRQRHHPRPYTIEALQQVLTFADEENPDLYLKTPSLVSMMKQAGYKTFWITNQQTMTKRNTMLTTFSEQADEQVYLNNNRNQNAASTTATCWSRSPRRWPIRPSASSSWCTCWAPT